MNVTVEAALAIATGFNMFCIIVAAVYIITLKVDPDDFKWLQPKPKDTKDGADTKVTTTKGTSNIHITLLTPQQDLQAEPDDFQVAAAEAQGRKGRRPCQGQDCQTQSNFSTVFSDW